jgi:oligopeptide/dipeptide ABC transporter ATP-binding protein
MLRVEELDVVYKTGGAFIKAVEDAWLRINANECVGLIGESGSGKSTIANAILRVLPENAKITRGRILFKDRNLLELTEEEMREVRGKMISMVFQEPHSSLNPVLKIGDQILETLKSHQPNLTTEEAKRKAIELLEAVRIPDAQKILDRYPFQLSGGMAQRVAIALALSSNPSLLIADEPTSALDLTIQAQLVKLLTKLIDTFKFSILLITHDLSLVTNLANRVYVMYMGSIVEEDRVDNLLNNPLHPYTIMLINAVKRLQGAALPSNSIPELKRIRGLSACKFSPRCPLAKPICFKEAPPYVEISTNKKVRCWLYT